MSAKAKSSSYHTADVLIGMVMAIAVAIGIFVFNNQDNAIITQKDNSPSRRILLQTPQEELDFIRSVLEGNPATSSHASTLPATASELAGVEDQEDEDPVKRAAAWLINKDPVNDETYLAIRYALAVVYYNNNGVEWTNNENWLSESSHCDWYGVGCCSKFFATPTCAGVDPNQIVDLDLYRNNLSGEMHDVLALFTDLRSLFLMKNQITGTINSNALGSLPNLMKLYLQHNKLTGTVSSDIKGNDLLDTLYVQGNSLTGRWPSDFCLYRGSLAFFGLDCGEIDCSSSCCLEKDHCHKFPETTE